MEFSFKQSVTEALKWRMVKKLCMRNKNYTFAEINELR